VPPCDRTSVFMTFVLAKQINAISVDQKLMCSIQFRVLLIFKAFPNGWFITLLAKLSCITLYFQNFHLRNFALTHLSIKASFSILLTNFDYKRLVYGLDDWDFMVRFSAGAGNYSLHHRIQNGSGSHLASYPMGTRGSFPGGKAAGAWSWSLTSI